MKKIYFLLSALALAFSVDAQTVTGGDMEAWHVGSAGSTYPKVVRAPNNWYGVDSLIIADGQLLGSLLGIPDTVWQQQVFKDSAANAHGGSYAAKLVTEDQDTLGIFPGLLTNAVVSVDLTTFAVTFSGGQATTLRTTSVSAWIKYAPTNTLDSANILVQTYGDVAGNPDSLLGVGTVRIGATPAFTQFTANVVYANPALYVNNVRITFASSSDTAFVGSTMWVDDVTMTGVAQVNAVNAVNAQKVSVYPNPASDVLYLEGGAATMECSVVSVNGQVVATKSFNGKSSIDLSALASGLYFYTITENGVTIQRGKVGVSK